MRQVSLNLLVVPMLLTLAACPDDDESIVIGPWVFIVSGAEVGLDLQRDGEVEQFIVSEFGTMLPGTLEWEFRGESQILLFHNADASTKLVYSGRVVSETLMNGTWVEWEPFPDTQVLCGAWQATR